MTEGTAKKTRRLDWRHLAYVVGITAALIVVLVAALAWYVSTPRFAARVHRKVVTVLERTTGGRVEMGAFRWSVRHLGIEVDDLTIHGKEAAGQVPYFHVDHLILHASILSVFGPKVRLNSLTAQRPTLHLIVYPDGTTNQPHPRVASHEPLPQALLNLKIGQTRVQNGLVLLNDRKIPWEMAAGSTHLTMRYEPRKDEYRIALDTKNITFRLKNSTEAHSRLRVDLSFAKDAATIENLDLQTGNSHLAASGGLRDFSAPVWHANVSGTVDARQVGAIAGVDDLRTGTATLNLAAHGAVKGKFLVSGHVDVRGMTWAAPWLTMRNVDLRTNLRVDNDTCALTDFSSVLEDQGRIVGSMVLRHCIGPSEPVMQPVAKGSISRPSVGPKVSPRALLERLHRKFEPKQPVTTHPRYQPLQADIEARISDVTLPLILAATAPKPYWNIGFTTAASGKVTVHWTGDGKGLDVHGDLMLSAPQRTLGLVPVSGPTHADYLGDHRHLVIHDANLHTPGTQVSASGTLDLLEKDTHSALKLDVVGHDLSEFDQLLTVTDLRATRKGAPHALPLKLLGNATYRGVVHGSFFALQTVGHLDTQGFQMVVEHNEEGKNGTASPVERFLTWDQFHGDVSYGPSWLTVRNAELARGDAVIHVGLDLLPDRTAPDTYIYNKQTQITATLLASRVPVSEVQSVLGCSYPIDGTLEVRAHVAGLVDDLEGSGQLMMTHGIVGDQAVSTAFMQLEANGHQLAATHIKLAAAGGMATGQIAYDDVSGALQGELTGQRYRLSQIALLQHSRVATDGMIGFHLQASGTMRSPIVTGAVQMEDLTMNGRPMGDLQAETRVQRGTLFVTSHAQLFQAHVDMGGQVQLGGQYPAQMQLTFANFNIDPLLRMMSSGIGGQSSMQGSMTLSGPLAQPSAIRADANLKAFSATVGSIPIHSEGPIEASLREGKLQLQEVHLQGRDVDMTARGTVDLMKNDALRLHSEGTASAGLATILDKNMQSSGEIHYVLNVRGTAHKPDLQGRVQLKHINVHIQNITNGLSDMNGEMRFAQDRLVVEHLEGSSGGGALDIKGFVGFQNGVLVDLTATTREVRIRYPKGVSSSVDARLRLLGTLNSILVSGDVRLMRFGVDSNVDLTSLVVGGPNVSTPIDPTSPMNRVHLDIHVTSAPELGFQNSFASLAGDVNLRIRGTAENPSVLGRIDITEGTASFAGTKYQLQQGAILFNNPVTIAPEIDLEATARVQNYDIIIALHGPPSKLEISYRSEPPLTQADVLALLALGRTNEQAAMYGEQQQAGANLTTEALLGGALNAAVSSRVQRLFGVGSVRVDPNFVGTLGESTARITVQQQVGRNLMLTFATNVNTTAQQLIQGQLDLTRNVSIIAVRDEANVFSMYLQIRGRHK